MTRLAAFRLMSSRRNAIFALLIAVAVHAGLALGLVAYFRHAPGPEALATLDLSSVDLSFAEKDDETAAVTPSLPSVAEPKPPRPKAVEAPPPPEDLTLPRPPDPAAMRFAEPAETHPVMKTPEKAVEKPKEPQARPAVAAPSAPAVAPKQARVDAPPKPKRTIRPDYPRRARQRGEEGEVTLEICVDAEGRVDAVEVVGSSGFAELDEAAVRAARAARFTPARSGDRSVASTARLKLAFRLR